MKRLFFIIFSLGIYITASAQSNPNDYRNMAAMHLWTQNCEKAQKCYNVYRELSGKSSEKISVLIAQKCQGKSSDRYVISYNLSALLSALEKSSITDKDLILRVLSMYSSEEDKYNALCKLASVYPNVYEALAKGVEGDAWYNSINVQKK